MEFFKNILYHYTSFESSLRIVTSQTLRFGKFSNMNDIAEVKREVFGFCNEGRILKELDRYQIISFTIDDEANRGFSIDPLWGHYSQKGNGVCLVFDKTKIETSLKNQYGNKVLMKKIDYLEDFTNAIFTEGYNQKQIKDYISDNIESIFFTKAIDWEYEKEYRILLNTDNDNELFNFNLESLIAVILCLPKVINYEEINGDDFPF